MIGIKMACVLSRFKAELAIFIFIVNINDHYAKENLSRFQTVQHCKLNLDSEHA